MDESKIYQSTFFSFFFFFFEEYQYLINIYVHKIESDIDIELILGKHDSLLYSRKIEY